MSLIGIIGGSGLSQYPGLQIDESRDMETAFGMPSAPLRIGRLNQHQVVFLPRHGDNHHIAPHRINYRANIDALRQLGVSHILAVAAVGGISEEYGPGTLAVPDQLIDYTHSREVSFFSDAFSADKHIDFTYPYHPAVREAILEAGRKLTLNPVDGGTYGAVQGPRLETAAEIRRMAKDGCDLVGMTGMPEAYLAKEAGIPYATLAVVANWAAGVTGSELSMAEIEQTLAGGIDNVRALIAGVIGLPSLR
ncbi:S-methyl-5'-thioinosine phosphorylase [Methylophaga sp.]|uniref:S-methyl-5'-thioinosine phosphorylase n=1 Tax=Methylophaga sp. TaxID=2024840 RepID=UPI0013FFF2C0|nr:S-methyl-5'-thioinosine phosphorylase [Methylophaga sp.]MTI62653.1 S-methyl-5'-thioinosine phosphorylase [Methylophaga sp.]